MHVVCFSSLGECKHCCRPTGEAPRPLCNVAVVFPSNASLSSAVSSCMDTKEHKTSVNGRSIITCEHSERVRVCMTAGYSKSLENELSIFCTNDASVIVPIPALFSEVFALRRGSAHRLEICPFASSEHQMQPPLNVANLVTSLFRSASPGSVKSVLSSSSPRYSALSPSSLVNKQVSVDGIVSVLTPPLFFSFRRFSVYFVAVCTGTVEEVSEATKMLNVNHSSVCAYIRVAVFQMLRKMEQTDSIEKAIHETADISVPEALLYSTDNSEKKRLLPVPRSTPALEKNQRIVREFFTEHVLMCLGNAQEIERFSSELIGGAALRDTKRCMDGSVDNRELVYQAYLQWKMKIGDDIDLVPIMDLADKLGLKELKDRCRLFVQEHSFRFTLHELDCTCFVEE
jgi:hypothetical protein